MSRYNTVIKLFILSIILILFVSGCTGPSEKESFFLGLNSIFGTTVLLFFMSIIFIKYVDSFRDEGIRDLPKLMITQLLFILFISGFISYYICCYRNDIITHKFLGDDPLTEWIAHQLLTIVGIPIIALYACIGLSIVRLIPILKYFYLILILLFQYLLWYIKVFHLNSWDSKNKLLLIFGFRYPHPGDPKSFRASVQITIHTCNLAWPVIRSIYFKKICRFKIQIMTANLDFSLSCDSSIYHRFFNPTETFDYNTKVQ